MKHIITISIALLGCLSLLAQNHRPVADAGEDITVGSCDEIKLSGSGTDEDGDKLTYFWEIPDELIKYIYSSYNTFSKNIELIAPAFEQTRSFTLKLFVSDGILVSEPDELALTIEKGKNSAPILDISDATLEVVEGQQFHCTINKSIDPDGHYIRYYADYLNKSYQELSSLKKFNLPVDVTKDSVIQIKVWSQDCELKSNEYIFDVKILENGQPEPEISGYLTFKNISEKFGYARQKSTDTLTFYALLQNSSSMLIDHVTWVIDNDLDTFNTTNNSFSCVLPELTENKTFKVNAIISAGSYTSPEYSQSIDVEPYSSYFDYSVIRAYDMLRSQQLFGVKFQELHYYLDDRIVHEREQKNLSFQGSFLMNNLKSIYMGLIRNMEYCSKVIAMCEETNIENAASLIAELKYLRAINMFYGAILFHEFPTVSDQSTGNFGYYPFVYNVNKIIPASKSDIFKQITSDLTDAINVLPINRTENKVRAKKTMAQAFLGKVYLYNQEWENAKTQFELVINSNQYALIQPQGTEPKDFLHAFGCNFTPIDLVYSGNTYNSEFNSESIIEIPFKKGAVDGYVSINPFLTGWMSEASLLNQYFSIPAWKAVMADSSLFNIFKATDNHPGGFTSDPRRYVTLWEDGDSIMQYDEKNNLVFQSTFNHYINSMNLQGSKWGLKKNYYLISTDPDIQLNSENNWRLMRYSDLLLMHAEACYHTGDTAAGRSSLNMVRTRVGMPEIPQLTPEAIIHERDVELAGECIRFHDLMRWSQLPDPWIDFHEIFPNTNESDLLLPIPADYLNPILNTVYIPENRKKYETIGKINFTLETSIAEFSDLNGYSCDNQLFSIEDNNLITLQDINWNDKQHYNIYIKNGTSNSSHSMIPLIVARRLAIDEFNVKQINDSVTEIIFNRDIFSFSDYAPIRFSFRLSNANPLPYWITADNDVPSIKLNWHQMKKYTTIDMNGFEEDFYRPYEIIIVGTQDVSFLEVSEAAFIEIAPLGDLIEYHSELAQYVSTYPNPTKSTLNVKISLQDEDVSYFRFDLYDLQGNIVRSEIRYQNPELLKMDVNDLTHGVYLLRSQVGTKIETKKIIIE